MTKTVLIALLLSVTALLAFGIFAMSADGSCIAEAAKGVACPEGAGPLGILSFHLDAFKDLAAAGATAFAAAAISAVLLLASVICRAGWYAAGIPDHAERVRPLDRSLSTFTPPLLVQLSSWTALHEKSPSMFLRRSR